MHIGIDANPITRKFRTGTEWYEFNLLKNMMRLPIDGNKIELYSNGQLPEDLGRLPDGWSGQRLKWQLPGWSKIRLSARIMRKPPDVLFVPAHSLPRICPRTTVATVHDVVFRRFPNLYEPSEYERLVRTTNETILRASHIITVSSATQDDLFEYYSVPRDRVSVVHLASDTEEFYKRDSAEQMSVRKEYGLSKHFFLCIGRVELKKNIDTLVRAFELFKSSRPGDDPFELVLVGKGGYGFDAIQRMVAGSAYEHHIKGLGWVKQADIPALISAAAAYVFPSRGEGFGMPALEAQACGTPLLCSDIPALREVSGNGAAYVSTDNHEEWSALMHRVTSDEAFANNLRELGAANCVKFSWEQTAKKTLSILLNQQYAKTDTRT
ncbi:TPA: hypothetical protein DCZ32_04165 [Candidatus Uhrbacteria bacterium]|nr:hypothetical protein [Candidatus Uhrbacteria bacterium]